MTDGWSPGFKLCEYAYSLVSLNHTMEEIKILRVLPYLLNLEGGWMLRDQEIKVILSKYAKDLCGLHKCREPASTKLPLARVDLEI